MLVIRREQLEAFRRYMSGQFEDRMVAHLKRYFPDRCAPLSDEEVRESIRYGVERADAYEICIEQDVSRYINLMYILGRDFDRDPDLPWAQAILSGRALKRLKTVKMDVLYEEAERYLARAHNGQGKRGPA